MAYENVEERTGEELSKFREIEKKYKRKITHFSRVTKAKKTVQKVYEDETDFSDVIDVDTSDTVAKLKEKGLLLELTPEELDASGDGYLNTSARVYVFHKHPGFILVRNAISSETCSRLATDCFTSFLEPPTTTNFNKSHGFQLKDIWQAYLNKLNLDMEQNGNNCRSIPLTVWSKSGRGKSANHIIHKLRWASIGPTYDWTKREYMENDKYLEIPSYIVDFTNQLFRVLKQSIPDLEGLDARYNPNAALVNYYRDGDTLCGHLDDAEKNLTKPLVSISLGCPAVFLMGGISKDVEPTAMYLREGDVAILSGLSRKSYHGVPRIFPKVSQFKMVPGGQRAVPVWEGKSSATPVDQYLQNCRVNISVRDVTE